MAMFSPHSVNRSPASIRQRPKANIGYLFCSDMWRMPSRSQLIAVGGCSKTPMPPLWQTARKMSRALAWISALSFTFCWFLGERPGMPSMFSGVRSARGPPRRSLSLENSLQGGARQASPIRPLHARRLSMWKASSSRMSCEASSSFFCLERLCRLIAVGHVGRHPKKWNKQRVKQMPLSVAQLQEPPSAGPPSASESEEPERMPGEDAGLVHASKVQQHKHLPAPSYASRTTQNVPSKEARRTMPTIPATPQVAQGTLQAER